MSPAKDKPKIIVVLGPTASGKSDLAIHLARAFNGEIISADSRQVYRGMNIGSGKVTKAEQRLARHHLLDVASPTRHYTVAHFQRDAKRAISDIMKRGKLPIMCGGTGFWIEVLLNDAQLPKVKPNYPLRKILTKKSTAELAMMLQKMDPERLSTIDRHNPVRLLRAIEIASELGSVPKLCSTSPYAPLILGITRNQADLSTRIHTRLLKRLRGGMLAEVQKLHVAGVSYKKLEAFGLEYRYCALYLQGKLTKEAMVKKLENEIQHYAKRQMTWFRRMEKTYPIHWVQKPSDSVKLVKQFFR